MNKTLKIVFILIITFLLVSIFNEVFAIDTSKYTPKDITTEDTVEIVEKVGIILGLIKGISVIVSVIVLMLIGFKYMLGSVEEKAHYKETMTPYIIGCVLATSGSVIVSAIYDAIH